MHLDALLHSCVELFIVFLESDLGLVHLLADEVEFLLKIFIVTAAIASAHDLLDTLRLDVAVRCLDGLRDSALPAHSL